MINNVPSMLTGERREGSADSSLSLSEASYSVKSSTYECITEKLRAFVENSCVHHCKEMPTTCCMLLPFNFKLMLLQGT